MITAITFTCARDAEIAARNAAALPSDWRKVWIVSPQDVCIPLPDGIELFTASFPRGGTLRGLKCCTAMMRIFKEFRDAAGEDCDGIVKIDSDVLLRKPGLIGGRTHTGEKGKKFIIGIKRRGQHGELMGGCYRMSPELIDAFFTVHAAQRDQIAYDADGHEDIFFTRLALRAGGTVVAHPNSTADFFNRPTPKTIWSHGNII